MKLNHETISLLLAAGTLALLEMERAELANCLPENRAKVEGWISADEARYERQRVGWYAASVALAALKFPEKDGNEAGCHSPGQSIHRGGNFIKASRFFSAHCNKRVKKGLNRLASNARKAAARMSSVVIEVGIAPPALSNLNVEALA